MPIQRSFTISALVLLLACGDDNPSTGSGTGAGGAGGGSVVSYSVTFDPLTVAPSEERTQCVVKRLGNDKAIHVNRITNTMGNGSHHLFVYKTTDSEEQLEPFECQPFVDILSPDKVTLLMISQTQGGDTLQLPPGVGLEIGADQMIRLELHYINASTSSREVSSTVTFEEMPESEVEYAANLLMMGNNDIELEPGAAATLGPQFIATPASLNGVNFFGFSGHQHKFGTGVEVATANAAGEQDTVVYAPPNFVWSEPPIEYLDPPIQVPEGGGFRFSCQWDNTSTALVSFGESANDEMCLFYGYYYPSQGAIACAHTGFTEDFCCPGHPICSML